MTNKLIIGVSGKKGSGKNTAVNQMIAWIGNILAEEKGLGGIAFVVDELGRLNEHGPDGPTVLDLTPGSRHHTSVCAQLGIRILTFATPIKEFCIDVMGLKRHQVWGTDDEKNQCTNIMWDGLPMEIRLRYSLANDPVDGSPIPRHGLMTGREIMQVLGTDIMRAWSYDIWANACVWLAQSCPEPIVLICDVRFPNELKAIIDACGKLVRLARAPFANQDQHESETALDDTPNSRYDYVIPDGTIASQGEHIAEFFPAWLEQAQIDLSDVEAEDGQ